MLLMLSVSNSTPFLKAKIALIMECAIDNAMDRNNSTILLVAMTAFINSMCYSQFCTLMAISTCAWIRRCNSKIAEIAYSF